MSLLRGLQWVPGVEAVEIQKSTGLQIDSKTLSYTCKTEIHVAQPDTWRAIHGLLGLQKDEHNRHYLGAAHPQFVDEVNGEKVPMLWADSINVTPVDDFYKDSENPQILNWKTTALEVSYSNDSLH